MHSFSIVGTDASADEAAAAMAAIACLLQEEAAVAAPLEPAEPAGWRGAARLITQGLAPSRPPAAPTWGRVERLRRAGRGGSGIVGL
jgi:hypothetical protein